MAGLDISMNYLAASFALLLSSSIEENPLMPVFLTIEQLHRRSEIAEQAWLRDYAMLRIMENMG